ncbi:MAG: M48 family metallopeptidase [Oligoflexia bacterium]|nr:M48 family metallopeptidase [Oligoflexia bacterium]
MKTLLILIFTVALSGCRTSGTGLNLISPQQEASQGAQYAAQVEKEYKVMKDPVLQSYINNLGRKMVAQVENPMFEYTFAVIDSSEVNAFAIPGGHMYVNLALLKQAENEAELVGVLGHEIGHVVHRHGTKRMTDAMLVQIAAAGTAIAVGNEKGGQYYGMGVMLLGQGGLLHYGRQAELESDHTGVDILYRSGYDVNGLASFFKKLQKLEEAHGAKRGGLSDLLRTHPPSADRIKEAQAYIAKLPPQKKSIVSTPEFEAMKAYVAPMTPTPPAPPKKKTG